MNVRAIEGGRWPPHLSPFAGKVDVPELDTPVPEELRTFEFKVPERIGDSPTTIRQLKKLFFEQTTLSEKKILRHLYKLEADALRPELGVDKFVAACKCMGEEKHSAVEKLGARLGLNLSGHALPKTGLTEERAKQLYDVAMEKIAENVRKEEVKKDESTKLEEARLKRLQESTPDQLLERTVANVVQRTMRGEAPGEYDANRDKGINYTKAYVGRYDSSVKPEDCVAKNDGEQGRRSASARAKGQERQTKGQGKGKGKDKQKGPGKVSKKAGNNHQDNEHPLRDARKGEGKGKGNHKGTGKGKGKGTGKNNQAQAGKGKAAGKGKKGGKKGDASGKGKKGKKGGGKGW